MIRFLLFVGLIFCLSLSVKSQFVGGLVAGFNASQINGDDLAGYNKLGLNTGIIGGYQWKEKFGTHIEFLYSQKGSRSTISQSDITRGFRINYIEVPVYVTFYDWEKGGFYRIQAEGGLSFGRLISTSSIGDFENPILDGINKNEISWLLGATYFFRENTGVNLRYTHGINRLHNDFTQRFRSFLLSLRLKYYF